MEKELQRKIDWLQSRHQELHDAVEMLETDPRFKYSNEVKNQLTSLKKEKLRVKDMIAMMKNMEK